MGASMGCAVQGERECILEGRNDLVKKFLRGTQKEVVLAERFGQNYPVILRGLY
jgi:hypothetical protein